MSRLIEYIIVGLNAFMLAIEGFHIGTWIFWLNMICMAAIYLCGYYKGKGEKL